MNSAITLAACRYLGIEIACCSSLSHHKHAHPGPSNKFLKPNLQELHLSSKAIKDAARGSLSRNKQL